MPIFIALQNGVGITDTSAALDYPIVDFLSIKPHQLRYRMAFKYSRAEMTAKKEHFLKLSPSERVIEEFGLARDQGVRINGRQAAQISTPKRSVTAAEVSIVTSERDVVVAGREGGIGLDLSVMRSTPNLLVESPLVRALDVEALRRATADYVGENLPQRISNLSPTLEIIAARGDNQELLRAATANINATLFPKIDSADAIGGRKNS